ncbi:MAG TPA: carboxylating nicotinate-nucleotide diphosphorylase [bacterium]
MLTTLPATEIDRLVQAALAEDSPWGDLTSDTFLPADATARLAARMKQDGVLCGLPVAEAVFRAVDPACQWEGRIAEGATVKRGDIVAELRGNARALLRGERIALNFLQRMSGMATMTAQFAAEAHRGNPKTRIIDTRKTTPGLRLLEKYAVRTGGGVNHRYGLSDGVLLKDNHLAVLASREMPLAQVIAQARTRLPHLCKIEVEVESLTEARAALDAGADVLLLDNMTEAAMAEAVKLCAGRAVTEASGNMTLDRVAAVAATGVDLISVGALTHSAPALDISLDFET